MIEVDLITFSKGKVKDYLYNIYVLKAGETVVYVGRSEDIYSRWFGPFGRLRRTRNWFTGTSSLAQMIGDNPSWDWKLQLWTVKESARFCKHRIHSSMITPSVIDRVETEMIIKLKPLENGNKTYFEDDRPVPDYIQAYYKKTAEEVSSVYEEVFGRKAKK